MHSLGELKDKPGKVIFIATIAGLWFVLRENFTAPLEITYLAIQISLYAQWQAPRPFASLYCRLAFKISLQILPPRHT